MFGLIRAPELDHPSLTWVGGQAPLRLQDLMGRIVLLDFFTPCCINCRHTQAALSLVKSRHGDRLTIIGIHSPKYDWERHGAGLPYALQDLGITHPVVHDPEGVLWELYTIKAWPSLVLIGPNGRIAGTLRGEPDPERLAQGLEGMIRQSVALKEMPSTPQPLQSHGSDAAAGSTAEPPPDLGPSPCHTPEDKVTETSDTNADMFRAPQALKPGPWPGSIVVADTGHDRILVFDREGALLARYGGLCGPGFRDGPSEQAQFRRPRSVVSTPEALWVADTGNHALRRIDLRQDRVDTVIGDRVRGLPLLLPQPVEDTRLASPWDLAGPWGDRLLIANAGTHQILAYDMARDRVLPLAGSGIEAMEDGPGDEALLAQPSGLALSPSEACLYFTDAESSSLRRMELARPYGVKTLIGTGLFGFGCADGSAAEAKMQFPQGLCLAADGDGVWVADRYNHRLCHWSAKAQTLTGLDAPWNTVLHHGEVSGLLALPGNRLLTAVSAQHRVLLLDLAQRTARPWGHHQEIPARRPAPVEDEALASRPGSGFN